MPKKSYYVERREKEIENEIKQYIAEERWVSL